MKKLKKISTELSKLEDSLCKCMKCGSCQAVCPVFEETLKESDVTRGKLTLLSNLSQSLTDDADGVMERLNRCLLCGSCQANCPSGVNILDIFIKSRNISVEYKGLSIVKKVIFRIMLLKPRLFSFLVETLIKFQKIFMYKKNEDAKTVCVPILRPFIGDRHLPQMPARTIRQKYGNYETEVGKTGIKVLFFAGCMGDKVYTNMIESCLKIFEYHGVGVSMPDNFACCGIPSLSSGDIKSFNEMAKYNLSIMKEKKFDYIVTPCASCTKTIENLWVEYSDIKNNKDFAIEVGKKTMDVNKFLVDIVGVELKHSEKNSDDKAKITYHDSCHLSKGLKITSQPRSLIKSNKEYHFVEMKDADKCCGCGGSFTLTHYKLSREIGQKKRDKIVESRAEVLTCACPACMSHISNILSLNGDNVKVKHVVEIYAESLK